MIQLSFISLYYFYKNMYNSFLFLPSFLLLLFSITILFLLFDSVEVVVDTARSLQSHFCHVSFALFSARLFHDIPKPCFIFFPISTSSSSFFTILLHFIDPFYNLHWPFLHNI